MSILVVGMNMPTECEYCGFCRYYPENGNVWCNAKNRLLKKEWESPHWTHLDIKRPDWCPLIEVKTQPEPEIYWGYTPTYERPLADDEIVPRLRDINALLGGSYAIDRAIEIIEAVAERRIDE